VPAVPNVVVNVDPDPAEGVPPDACHDSDVTVPLVVAEQVTGSPTFRLN